MHCSRVFRSSVPSDLSPSSPGRCRQAPLRVNAAALDQRNGGSAPVAECHIEGAVRQSCCPAGHIREGTLPGPVRSQGRGAHDSQGEGAHDPELVARAQRGATYLGSAWNNGATAMNALSAGRPRASKHSCSRSRFSQAPFSRSTWPNCRRKARRIPKFGRCLAHRRFAAAAASRRIRPGIWPPSWSAGAQVSFPARVTGQLA